MSSPNLYQELIVNGGADTTGDSFPVVSKESSLWAEGTFNGATVTFQLSRNNVKWIDARDDFDAIYSIDGERAAIRMGWMAPVYQIRVVITGGNGSTALTVIRDGV